MFLRILEFIKSVPNKFRDKVVSFFSYIKRKIPRRQKNLLFLINKEKKSNKSIERILKNRSQPLWIPSVNSFSKVLFIVLLFWFLIHPDYFIHPIFWFLDLFFSGNIYYEISKLILSDLKSQLPHIPYLDFASSHYQNLIAINAGIGSVLVGLAFFVAQSLTDKSDPEKGRVLLYKSYFFPLLVSEILTFLLFIWGDINILILIPTLLVAGLTIWSLGRVINVLIKDYELEKAKVQMLLAITTEKFVEVLDFEITKRLGENRLKKHLDESGIFEFSPWGGLGDKKDFILIKSKKGGLIKDVSLSKLSKFIREIEKVIAQNNKVIADYSIKETKQTSADISRSKIGYFSPSINHEIGEGDVVLWIKQDIFGKRPAEEKKKIINRLDNLVQNIFLYKSLQNPGEEARSEISKIKDRCLRAINERQTGELHKIIELYIELVEEFYAYLESYGGGFSSKQAEEERSSIFGKLNPIKWLSEDIREIFQRGIDSKDRNIIRDVAYLPVQLARLAVNNNDHLIFQEFIPFSHLIYSAGLNEKKDGNEVLADLLFDRTWRYLKELSDYTLVPTIEEENFSEEDFKNFIIYLLKVFQSLLKSTLDNKDIKNFKVFITKILKLFNNLNFPHYGLSTEQEDKIEAVHTYLSNKRKEMLFGLAARIFFLYKNNKTDELLRDFYNTIISKLPPDIKELTSTFLGAHDFKTEDFWGWDHWDSEDKEEGEVHSVRVLEKLEEFYAVFSLSILQGKSDEEISRIDLPTSRDMAFLAEGTRDLIKTLNHIEQNPDAWSFVVPPQAISKVGKLKELLNKAKAKQEEIDLKIKRDTPISSTKVELFRENVVKDFNSSLPLRKILFDFKLYEDRTPEEYSGEIKKLGINTLFEKAPFFDESVSWYVHFVGIENAFGFGEGMARGENKAIIETIKSKCEKSSIDQLRDKISSFERLKDVIIVSVNNATWGYFEKSEHFTSKWRHHNLPDTSEQICGTYKIDGVDLPVYEVFDGGEENGVLIIDKTNFGTLIQYNPLDSGEDSSLKKDIFLINVQEFSSKKEAELLREFLFRNTPPWLNDIGSKEKQLEHLKERVLIRIYQRFEFVMSENFKGYFLPIS